MAVQSLFFIETKDFKQDVVWEHADCRCLTVTQAVPCATESQYSLRSQWDGVAEGPTLTMYVLSFLAAALGGLPDM